jgi:hypothetical protein
MRRSIDIPQVSGCVCLTIAIAVLSACSKPISIREEISVDGVWLHPGMKVEIFADNEPVTYALKTEQFSSPALKFAVTSELRGKVHHSPDLKIRVLDSCGWQESALKFDQNPDIDSVRTAGESGQPLYYSSPMPRRPNRAGVLWLDNRGGQPGVLKLGQIEMPVEADTLKRIETTGCPSPVPISFAGASLGELPIAPTEDSLSVDPWAIADPSGRRCYQEFRVFYGRAEDGGGGHSEPAILSGAKLYLRPQFIAYVMEDAPGMKMARLSDDNTAWVLKDAKCPKS